MTRFISFSNHFRAPALNNHHWVFFFVMEPVLLAVVLDKNTGSVLMDADKHMSVSASNLAIKPVARFDVAR